MLLASLYRNRLLKQYGFINILNNSSKPLSQLNKNTALKLKERNVDEQVQTNVITEKITQTGKDLTYFSIVAIGFGVTGLLFYVIGKELLSNDTPTALYSRAFDIIKLNPQVLDLLGPPIKAFGEDSGRGRRRLISHTYYQIDNVNCIRMKFYVKGVRKQATAYLEASENVNHHFEFSRLIIQTAGYPEKVINLLKD